MAEHTPGPWGWFGSAQHGFYLSTVNRGRQFVMDFVRLGPQRAQPRFQIKKRGMIKGQELVQFEVDPSVVGYSAGKAAPSVYRFDICGIDHPDARLIAAAPALLEALVYYQETFCEGFCKDCPPGFTSPEMETDCSGCKARAAIAAAKGEGE